MKKKKDFWTTVVLLSRDSLKSWEGLWSLKGPSKKTFENISIFLVIIFGEFSCAQRLCSKMEIGWSFWPLIVSQLVR
jgi:hypothetical protein